LTLNLFDVEHFKPISTCVDQRLQYGSVNFLIGQDFLFSTEELPFYDFSGKPVFFS